MSVYLLQCTPDGELHDTANAEEMLAKHKRLVGAVVDIVGQSVWDSHTHKFEFAYRVKREFKKRAVQLAAPVNVSNAFFKALELFRIAGMSVDDRLFDNASLPGDFIRAAIWRYGVHDWRANSLVAPDALDDRYGLVGANPTRWSMTANMNGDITVAENRQKIIAWLGDWRPTVYTSDLGFAIRDPMREEQEHFPAHAAQIEFGFEILAPGGTMIVKSLNIFTQANQALLARCTREFRAFRIVKPLTSKADNSECYWMGWGYREAPDIVAASYRQWSIASVVEKMTRRQCDKLIKNIRWMLSGDPEVPSDEYHRMSQLVHDYFGLVIISNIS